MFHSSNQVSEKTPQRFGSIGRRRSAFTLIELLVVVALIVLLISILLPSLSRARELTNRTVCATNQRQILNGVLLYAAANESYLVGEGVRTREGQDPNFYNDMEWRSMWVGVIGGYTLESAAEEFYCPSMKPTVSSNTAWPVPMPWGGEFMLGYPYFGHYLSATNDPAYNWGGTLPSPRRSRAEPATPLFADWNRGDMLNGRWGIMAHSRTGIQGPFADTYGGSVPHMSAPPWSGYAAVESAAISPEGANNALLDGSVQWFTPDTFEIAVHSFFLWAKTQ